MLELDFLNIINSTLSNNLLLGNDCAYLPDLNIAITQDNLIEDVHFSLSTISPYQLGKKSIAVNLSDLAAFGSSPKYISIGLAIPSYINKNFISEFYRGINHQCSEYNLQVTGGDITSSKDKLFISICAIGVPINKNLLPFRNNSKVGDIILTTGYHGSSALGFAILNNQLLNNYFSEEEKQEFILSHLDPEPQIQKSNLLMRNISQHISMMDSSDGLADALFKLSTNSNTSFIVDLNKVPMSDKLKKLNNYLDLLLFGGEDYQLVFTVSKEDFHKLDKHLFFEIGYVSDKVANSPVLLKDNDKNFIINDKIFNERIFNHFKDSI